MQRACCQQDQRRARPFHAAHDHPRRRFARAGRQGQNREATEAAREGAEERSKSLRRINEDRCSTGPRRRGRTFDPRLQRLFLHMPGISPCGVRGLSPLPRAEIRGIGDNRIVAIVHQAQALPLGTLGENIDRQNPGPFGKPIGGDIVPGQLQGRRFPFEQIGRFSAAHDEGCEASRPDPGAQIEQPASGRRYGGAKQDAVTAGTKPAPGLRQSEPTAQKGVARGGLVFYKFGWLV